MLQVAIWAFLKIILSPGTPNIASGYAKCCKWLWGIRVLRWLQVAKDFARLCRKVPILKYTPFVASINEISTIAEKNRDCGFLHFAYMWGILGG